MTKLISANFVKNEAHNIKYMLDCVQPYVDASYVLIDRETTDNTKEICDERGCVTDYFDFKNFAKVWNQLLRWINDKGNWAILIAPDETISKHFGSSLKYIAQRFDESDVDGVWFPRRHWKNLEMTELFEKDAVWYPDWQLRLMRLDYPRIHMINLVHEVAAGMRRTVRIEDAEINHFNAYWKPRIAYDWDKMNQLYHRLTEEQKKNGGDDIWPD